jgi:hypothetical protein
MAPKMKPRKEIKATMGKIEKIENKGRNGKVEKRGNGEKKSMIAKRGKDENPRPAQSLFIRKHWCDEIFRGSKRWEIRDEPCDAKVGSRICVAQSKANELRGEVTIVKCLRVGVRGKSGELIPAGKGEEAKANFILNLSNMSQHCIEDLSILDKYEVIYAWVLDEVVEYEEPVPWVPKPGAVKFTNLAGRVPMDMRPAESTGSGQ